MQSAAAVRRAPATDAPALRSAACFPRASGGRDLGLLSCAQFSARARPGDCELPGDLSSWRPPPSMLWSLVRLLRSRCDCHHKNALSHWEWVLPYSTAGPPAEKRCPRERKPAPRLCAPLRIRPASRSRCHPVRSLAEASARDLRPADGRHDIILGCVMLHSRLCDASRRTYYACNLTL
jgi:hypothetical protein